MSAFTIIIVIVTLAYIIYYGAAISQEVIRVRKEETPDTETFTLDGSDTHIEQPVSVVETEGGFQVERNNMTESEPSVSEDKQMVIYENLPSEEPKENLHEGMNEVDDAKFGEEYPADDFEIFMQNRLKNALQPVNDESSLDRI